MMKKYIISMLLLMLQALNATNHLKPTTPYYQKLADKCQESNCCLSSLDSLIAGHYALAPENGTCPKGYRRNMLLCIDSYAWCEKD